MTAAAQEFPDTFLTAEPKPAGSLLEVVPSPELPPLDHLLGNTAIASTIHGSLYEIIAQRANTYRLNQTQDFAHLLQTAIVSHIQAVNVQKNRPENSNLQKPPNRMSRAINDYFNVYYNWEPRIDPYKLEEQRQAFLRENVSLAWKLIETSPEIFLLTELEAKLRESASDTAADVALELLAIYGWTSYKDFATRRMELLRNTENVHMQNM